MFLVLTCKDEYVISPYGYNNLDWMGYEDWESVVVKAQYVQDLGIAGAFVWAIDNDDFMNKCGAGENPIIRTLAEVFCK